MLLLTLTLLHEASGTLGDISEADMVGYDMVG